ncbi:unnamed protein product [Adineta steineri]|uniref:Purple acid phosphatase n=1 Tax=Adineta steineri TaxID=433720 RepID=A0A814IXV4_9BILA|nr:unnamed protein product [Adineta steineri]CAF1028596.1 unnamed protein product [Adineta steineri]CAF1389268.1 unnamed protein product [Adineta steineri]
MLSLTVILTVFCIQNVIGDNYQPEQIHLSYTGVVNEMAVTWSTQILANESYVEYSLLNGQLDMIENATMSKFIDGSSAHRVLYMYRATLKNLSMNTSYIYHVGSSYGWSSVYSFRTIPHENRKSFAVYGDLGVVNAQSLARLQREAQLDYYDAILHVGDFAYDMDADQSRVGDQFMNEIQEIATHVPYMVCPGNHERAYNFSNYKSRFTMPSNGDGENLWYSYNFGLAHIISFSTEVYFWWEYGFAQISNQYRWLEQDLKWATASENRTKYPWIITMGHQPMYCSNANQDDCTFYNSRPRSGLPYIHTYGLEKMFYDYGVDLELWAHEHSYERLWPIYDWTIYNGSLSEPYKNPGAPTHVITGSAGCYSKHNPFLNDTQIYSAFRSDDYGYSRMKIINSTHLYIEQVSDDQDGKVIDNLTLIREKHEPYTNHKHKGIKIDHKTLGYRH